MISRRLRATHFVWVKWKMQSYWFVSLYVFTPMLIKRSENFGPLMVVSLFFVGGLVGESLRTLSKHVTLKNGHRWYIPDFAQPNQPNPLVGFDDLTLHSTRSCGTSRFGICGRQVGWEVCEPRLRPISQRRPGMEAPKIRLGIICLFLFLFLGAQM